MNDGNKPGCLVKIHANQANRLEDTAVEGFNNGYLSTIKSCE